ncbi:MAG: glutamine amidotransferase [bacterium]|nr:glutamine amidotransferase [bacterium]
MARDGSILVVKTGEALAPVKAARGDFHQWIAKGMGVADDELAVAHVHAGDPLPDPASISGVVVTGSPLMVTDRADWSEASAAWLAKIVEADAMPVLGICYGHQLLAHALGGEVGANPNGREMGTVEVRHDTAAIVDDPVLIGAVEPGHMSHLESVLRPPSDAQVLATTDLEAHAVLKFGPRQWGLQYHPEFDRDIMQGYVAARREIIESEGLDPDAMIENAVETPVLTSTLERFAAFVEKG